MQTEQSITRGQNRSFGDGDRPRNHSRQSSWAGFVTAVLLFILVWAIFDSKDAFFDHPFASVAIVLNVCLSTYGMYLSIVRQSSTHFVSFLFSYLFMSIMPLVQIGEKIDPILGNDLIVIYSALGSIAFTICGLILTLRLPLASQEIVDQLPSESKIRYLATRNYALLAFSTFAFIAISVAIFGRSLFSSREGFGFALTAVFSDKATAGAVTNFLLQTPYFGAVIGLRAAIGAKKNIWIIVFFALLLGSFALNNPLITARFKLAGLAFFFVDYMFRGRKIQLLILLILVGLSLAPLFQVFRYEKSSLDDATYGAKFVSTDYDAFQMTCYTLVSVDQKGVSWGSNILGATLFFVPRSIWWRKPVPTSFEIYKTAINYRELGTDNLSVPLIAEGFFAFSWIGLIGISLAYWGAVNRLHRSSVKNSDATVFLFRSVFAGLVFILLRGPLIIGITSIVGNFFAALAAKWIFDFRGEDERSKSKVA